MVTGRCGTGEVAESYILICRQREEPGPDIGIVWNLKAFLQQYTSSKAIPPNFSNPNSSTPWWLSSQIYDPTRVIFIQTTTPCLAHNLAFHRLPSYLPALTFFDPLFHDVSWVLKGTGVLCRADHPTITYFQCFYLFSAPFGIMKGS